MLLAFFMCKISVVIPVYNSKNFIRQCMDSIIYQTFSEFEIICVDDGSTDESYTILSRYSQQYKNIQVVRQKNKGQGPARNKGVTLARGKYVKFVDADDYLHPDALRILYETAERTKADIIVSKAFCVNEAGDITSPLKMWNNLIGNYTRKSFINLDFFNNKCSPVLWDKLIKTKIAKTYLSPSLKRGQDFVTLIKYISACNNIYFIEDRLYYYRHHSLSIMATTESRETIMLDFTTEQMAIKVMQDCFQNTKAYSFYCKRILQEWANRIEANKELLMSRDIALIKNLMTNIHNNLFTIKENINLTASARNQKKTLIF